MKKNGFCQPSYQCNRNHCPLLDIDLIKLTRGKYAIVDSEDYLKLNKHKWHCYKGAQYAASHVGERGLDGKKKHVLMHRHILGIGPSDKANVDHINGHGTDNRKSNLRLCDNQKNHFNMKIQHGRRFKWTCFTRGLWQANIMKDGKSYYLGRYKTQELAAVAYNNKAVELFGEYARLNIIREPAVALRTQPF